MKKLALFLVFVLFCTVLSAGYMFDGRIIFSKHATAKDSLYYIIIEKAGNVLDTVTEFDTTGTLTWWYPFQIVSGSDTTDLTSILLKTEKVDVDSADIVVAEIDTAIIDGKLNIIDGELNTADSVRFVHVVPVFWSGGVQTINATLDYYSTNGVNDDLFSFAPNLSIPTLIVEGSVIVDTMTLRLYTQGNEDSVHIYFEKVQDGAVTKVDSVWFGVGTSGWAQSSNILQNGDFTVLDDYIYRIRLDCVNNGANDVRVEMGVRVVYHLE